MYWTEAGDTGRQARSAKHSALHCRRQGSAGDPRRRNHTAPACRPGPLLRSRKPASALGEKLKLNWAPQRHQALSEQPGRNQSGGFEARPSAARSIADLQRPFLDECRGEDSSFLMLDVAPLRPFSAGGTVLEDLHT